jgi:Leucine-rich repeat (LRR) protein
MRRRVKKRRRISTILGGALFALMALGMLYAVVQRYAPGEPAPEVTPEPTTLVATAMPAQGGRTTTVAGKTVDPETDSFDLSGRTLNSQDLSEISSLSNLQTLSLTNCGISDLSFLKPLTKLRTLYLPDNRINDLTPLTGLRSLKTLYLDKNPLTDLTPLIELPMLSMLSIQGVTIADYVLSDLQEAMPACRIFSDSVVEAARPISLGGTVFTEDVESLDLSYRDITDLGKLSYCLQLKDLNLTGNPLRSLTTLSGLPKLTILNLQGTGLHDEDLLFLATLHRLTYLDLRNNPELSAEALDGLAEVLKGCQIVHDDIFYTVELGGVKLTSDMTEADLTGRGLNDLHGLDKFVRLRRLVLYGNGLEDISPLAGCTALEELDLRFNKVRDLSPLYGCKELKLLEIGGNGALDPDEIRRLQEALPACTIVTDVDLSMPEPTPAPPGTEGDPASPAPERIPLGTPAPIPVGEPEG